MYTDHWDKVWNRNDIDEYRNYLVKYEQVKNSMTEMLHKYHVLKVCDAVTAKSVLDHLSSEGTRRGLLFHYYGDSQIISLFKNYTILLFETDERGNRHIIVQKRTYS